MTYDSPNRRDTSTKFNMSDGMGVMRSPVEMPKDIEQGEGYQNYMKAKADLDDVIKDLDVKLNRVLAKQEYEYLKGYNVYVR
jgi:hypothetical protein